MLFLKFLDDAMDAISAERWAGWFWGGAFVLALLAPVDPLSGWGVGRIPAAVFSLSVLRRRWRRSKGSKARR